MSSFYEPNASNITAMNLIATPRASTQRLKVTLLVGIELANALQQLFALTDSIWVYGDDMADLVYGNGVVV